MAGRNLANQMPTGRADPRFNPGAALLESVRNVRMMHLLERIARAFHDAGIPLLALKGAALNLVLYDRPDERPMGDLDLLVKPEDAEGACAVLEGLGCLRSVVLVREDFFPRFHYEIEYAAGSIYPVKIDLHVRPFRPLRYSRLVPPDALWERAEVVRFGAATIRIPAPDDMLIHLAVHAAIHGCSRRTWLQDIKRWADAHRSVIDWNRLVATAERWRLALAVRQAFQRTAREFGPVCSRRVIQRLRRLPVNWRDRLALWQAPRDASRPVMHVLVNTLCTPGWRFALGYLRAVCLPDRGHMGEWYCRRHWGWLPWAHLLRCSWPVVGRLRPLWTWLSKIETRDSRIHGTGVFATRALEAGELIARHRGREVGRDGPYVMQHKLASGEVRRYEITGKLKFLNHCCRPNAALAEFRLIALRPIRGGEEITIDYGEGACDCRRDRFGSNRPPATKPLAEVTCGTTGLVARVGLETRAKAKHELTVTL